MSQIKNLAWQQVKALEETPGVEVRSHKVRLIMSDGKGYFFDPTVPDFDTEDEAIKFVKAYAKKRSRRKSLDNRVTRYRLTFEFTAYKEVSLL